jgi:hypothetical protein
MAITPERLAKLTEDIATGNVVVVDVDLDDEEVYVDGERLTEARVLELDEGTLRLVRERRQGSS